MRQSHDQYISNGTMYVSDIKAGIWCRKCPTCNQVIEYISGRNSKCHAFIGCCSNAVCMSCRHKAHGAKRRGKYHTLKTRQNQSELMRNRPGRPHTEETKNKIRSIVLRAALEKGDSKVDKGAPEYFQYQNEQGYNFIENYALLGVGYVVDGYDPTQHIVCEYDTPYHNNITQQKKDLIRQKNIVKHFESIGNPLNQFVRVNATKPDNLSVSVVYRNTSLTPIAENC